MKKLFTFLMTMVIAMVANAGDIKPAKAIGEEATSITSAAGNILAIVNKEEGKAFYVSKDTNLAYDEYAKAFVNTNSCYQWRLMRYDNTIQGVENNNLYYIQPITPLSEQYQYVGRGQAENQNIHNLSDGYLQSAADGSSFVFNNKTNTGENTITNGWIYEVQYEEGKGFSLRNIGTGKYQGANTLSADEDEPTYFAFVQLEDDYITTVKELLAEGEAMKANVTDEDAKAAYDAAIADIDPDAITGNGRTEAHTVDDALNVLVKYQNAAGADMTRAITNPSFESGTLDGWTSTNGGTVVSSGWFEYKTGCYYFDKASPLSDGSLSQTLTGMPNGWYKLTAEMRNTENNTTFHKKYDGFYLVANGNRTAVQADGETVEVETVIADGTITIGTELDNCTGNWACVDNFQLTFVRPAINKEKLANDITVAQAIVDAKKNVGEDFFMISPEAPEKLQEAIDTANGVNENEDATQEEVDAAIAALAVATKKYNSSINRPDPEKKYVLYLTGYDNVYYMNLADGVKIQEEGTPLSFVEAEEGQYYLTTGEDLYVGLGDNNMLSTDAENGIALSFIVMGNNQYRIETPNGLVGTDMYQSLRFGSDCAANRGAGDNTTMWTIEECTTATMSVKAGKWGTFVAPFGVAIPEGIKAYKVTGTVTDADAEDTSYTKTEEVKETIPANTPVILLNQTEENLENTFTGGVRQPENETVTEGLLTGIYQAGIDIPAGSYVLQTPKEGEQGFYYVNETITGQGVANRCYLTMPAGSAPLRAIFFGSEEGTTGIEAVEATGAEDGILYNLAGQKVDASYKGIVIKKGKTMLKK